MEEFYGKVVDSKPVFDDANYQNRMKALWERLDGEDFLITIRKVRDAKSLKQMRFYRGVVLPALAQATGNANLEVLHNQMKELYLSHLSWEEETSVKGKVHTETVFPSLKDLQKDEMWSFTQRVLELMVDCGGSLPPHRIEEMEAFRNE